MDDSLSLSVLSDIPLDLESRLQWLLDREQELADIIARELSRVIETVYDEFLATLSEPEQLEVIVASGDIEKLGDIVPRWRMAIGQNIQPYLEQVYLSGGVSAYLSAPGTKGFTEEQAGQWADVVNQVAVDYSRQMTNRLVGVGDTAWKMIRGKVTKAIKSGASNEVLRNELINIGQFSEFRADVIARTEVQFAYSNGNWQAGQALGQYGPLEKEWLATSDARTRRSHANINGTRLPIAQPFQMSSGAQMMYPHDPSAPARETVQCRCVLLEYYAGDVRPDGSIVGQDQLLNSETVVQTEMAEQSLISQTQPAENIATESVNLSYRGARLSPEDFEGQWDDIIEKGGGPDGDLSPLGDLRLNELWRRQGFDSKPRVVSSDQYDQLVDSGWTQMHRGIAGDSPQIVDDYVDVFINGETPFAGKGMFGNGTYASRSMETADQFTRQTAGGAEVVTGKRLDLAIHPDAKIVDVGDLWDGMHKIVDERRAIEAQIRASVPNADELYWGNVLDAAPKELRDRYRMLSQQEHLLAESPSNYATVHGFDVIRIDKPRVSALRPDEFVDDTYYIILNRGLVAVKEIP